MASKKNMSDYKVLTRKLYPSPKRVQELIPVFKIGIDGVFQLEDLPDGVEKLYDKAYLFEDANFATMDDYEKEGAFAVRIPDIGISSLPSMIMWKIPS